MPRVVVTKSRTEQNLHREGVSSRRVVEEKHSPVFKGESRDSPLVIRLGGENNVKSEGRSLGKSEGGENRGEIVRGRAAGRAQVEVIEVSRRSSSRGRAAGVEEVIETPNSRSSRVVEKEETPNSRRSFSRDRTVEKAQVGEVAETTRTSSRDRADRASTEEVKQTLNSGRSSSRNTKVETEETSSSERSSSRGRARESDQQLGEMERDAQISDGIVASISKLGNFSETRNANNEEKIAPRNRSIKIKSIATIRQEKEEQNLKVEEDENLEKVLQDSDRFVEDRDLGFDLPTFAVNEEVDHSKTWRFEPMYKENLKGALMVHWVGFDVDTEEMLMAHGQVGGKIVLNRTKVVLNQSGRNMQEQSLLEVRQARLKKSRSGYTNSGEPPREIKEPMLAKIWDIDKTRLSFPCGSQPKLDGCRALARIDSSGKVELRSRGAVVWKPESQIFFEESIEAFISFMPGIVELDGEMYSHFLTFQEIVSIIKDPKKLAKRVDEISYNIFTYTDHTLPAEVRYANLVKAMEQYKKAGYSTKRLKLVEMRDAHSKQELLDFHKEYLQNQFEGSMIYKYSNGIEKNLASSVYKSGRSNNLLKCKLTLDGQEMKEEEGEIYNWYLGTGSHEGAILFNVIDPRGNKFKCGYKATIEERREMAQNGDYYIGKLLTYKFQELSDDGVPRFAIGKIIRDYE